MGLQSGLAGSQVGGGSSNWATVEVTVPVRSRARMVRRSSFFTVRLLGCVIRTLQGFSGCLSNRWTGCVMFYVPET